MKSIVFIILAALFFIIDWAALHDIIKGNEINFSAEYFTVVLSIIYFISAGYLLLKKTTGN